MTSSVKYQYYAAFCANILSVSYGAICGWPSASFLVLQSDNSPLDTGAISNEEASWIGAMLCIGGLIGNLVFAWIGDRCGRKIGILLAAIPMLVSWLLIPMATSVMHLCISRFLGGVAGGGVFSLVPIYVTEISEDRIRGSLGSYLVLSCNIGILIAFVLGNYLSYVVIPYIMATLPVLFLVGFVFLPETPQHLLRMKKEKEAEKSLRYFRNVRRISQEAPEQFKTEMQKLREDYLEDDKKGTDDSPLTWSDFTNRQARKAFMIGIALMALNQFCGCFAMINYTATIFKESGSNLSPNMSAIIVGVIQLLGAYVSTMLVERAGRKILMTLSALGTGIGLFCLGLYTNLTFAGYDLSSFQWVPVASFSFTIFIASWGVLTLPFLILSEIMPPKIRAIGCMSCMSILWIFAFLMLKFLTFFTEFFGMHGTMFVFASCSFAGATFIMIFVPETKGKSIDTILSLL